MNVKFHFQSIIYLLCDFFFAPSRETNNKISYGKIGIKIIIHIVHFSTLSLNRLALTSLCVIQHSMGFVATVLDRFPPLTKVNSIFRSFP